MSSPDPIATAAATGTTAPTTVTPATPTTGSAPATSLSATKTAKAVAIKAVTGFSKLTVNGLANLGGAVLKGMTGNAAFPSPPVDLIDFSTTLSTFSAAIIAALDGGKTAKAVQAKQRTLVTQDLTLLAVYAQNNCGDDPSVFMSSGFTAKSTAKTTNQPVAVPTFRSVGLGANSGQLLVSVGSVTGAKSYFVRYAIMTGTTPGAWTTLTVPTINKKLTFSSLTPGSTYGFQVQALGTLGYSDWSTTETIMCV